MTRYPYNFITAVHAKIKLLQSDKFKILQNRKSSSHSFYGKRNRPTYAVSKHFSQQSDKIPTSIMLTEEIREDIRPPFNVSKVLGYEKLDAKSTSSNLIGLLKLREKLLIYRTTCLILWLEVLKELFHSKGLQDKQQRLLLEMEAERQYIKRLLHLSEQKPIFVNQKSLSKLPKQSLQRSSSKEQNVLGNYSILWDLVLSNNTFIQELFRITLKPLVRTVKTIFKGPGQCSTVYYFYTKNTKLMNLWNYLTESNRNEAEGDSNQLGLYQSNNHLLMIPKNEQIIDERKYQGDLDQRLHLTKQDKQKVIVKLMEIFKSSRNLPRQSAEKMFHDKSTQDLSLRVTEAPFDSSPIPNSTPDKSVQIADSLLLPSINTIDTPESIIQNNDGLLNAYIWQMVNGPSSFPDSVKSLSFLTDLLQHLFNTGHLNKQGRSTLNVYDRIILDSTFEIIKELKYQEESANLICSVALNNPPNTIRCNSCIYCRSLRKALSIHNINSGFGNRFKCDIQDYLPFTEKIIIKELYNEDARWQNFQCEEVAVLKLLIDELIKQYITNIIDLY